MDIKYIQAAMAMTDHGSGCCCSICQTDALIIKDEWISPQTRAIAKLASEPIRKGIERAEAKLLELEKEYEITKWMTDREYSIYLSQPKDEDISPSNLIL